MAATVGAGLRRWLGRAQDAVMKPWRQFRQQPDPSGVKALQGAWDDEVDTITTIININITDFTTFRMIIRTTLIV